MAEARRPARAADAVPARVGSAKKGGPASNAKWLLALLVLAVLYSTFVLLPHGGGHAPAPSDRRAADLARTSDLPRAADAWGGSAAVPPADVFVVHWTHVPKAAGTAFAGLARRVACVRNPLLRESNPCCLRDLCWVKNRCHTSSASCPLVTGVGMHSAFMGRLTAAPCCGFEFVKFGRGDVLRGSIVPPAVPDDGDVGVKRSYVDWPLERRAEFFAKLGLLDEAKLVSLLSARNDTNPLGLADRQRVVAAARPHYASPFSALQGEGGPLFAEQDACVSRQRAKPKQRGTQSMTMLRHPVSRAISAYFYRGHSPNQDVFNLRPGLWLPASPDRPRMHIRLAEYLGLDEYSNVITKVFGDDCVSHRPDGFAACRRTAGQSAGDARGSCACDMVTQGCQAYHNASAHLGEAHVSNALAALEDHAFFGLLEAYNSSVRLLAQTFTIPLDDRDFEKTRGSTQLKKRCSPSRVMRLDGTACRAGFAANALDVVLYERAHRAFCARLEAAGLAGDAAVRRELDTGRLCGEIDHSNVDDVCGPLEGPDALADLEAARADCAKKKPGYWMQEYGFHSGAGKPPP